MYDDIIEESQKTVKVDIGRENQFQGSYEVYSDDNYDKFGNSQCHIGTYAYLEEAVQRCQEIVGNSVIQGANDYNTPEKIMSSWRFGGTTAFIQFSDAFSPNTYAEQVALELCSKLQPEQED